MSPLDHMERVRKLAASQLPAAVCPIDRPCGCPTCGVTAVLLRLRMRRRGFTDEDAARLTVRAGGLGGGHTHIASVRVDGREVYRIVNRPDEVFAEDVLADLERALRRKP